jgi:hypothetical protein
MQTRPVSGPDALQSEIERVLEEKQALWERKPPMLDGRNEPRPYDVPILKESTASFERPQTFVIQEQIDHRLRDPQMRCELYVLEKNGGEKARLVYEVHGYASEAYVYISVVKVEDDKIAIHTHEGAKIIPFKP